MEARLLIEPGAAERAATASPARRDGGRARSGASSTSRTRRAAAASQSFRDYYEADRRFHHAVVEGTGNRFLLQSYEALGGQFQRFRLFSGRGVTDADATIAEHGAIRDAIAAGDRGRGRRRDDRPPARCHHPLAERARRRRLIAGDASTVRANRVSCTIRDLQEDSRWLSPPRPGPSRPRCCRSLLTRPPGRQRMPRRRRDGTTSSAPSPTRASTRSTSPTPGCPFGDLSAAQRAGHAGADRRECAAPRHPCRSSAGA